MVRASAKPGCARGLEQIGRIVAVICLSLMGASTLASAQDKDMSDVPLDRLLAQKGAAYVGSDTCGACHEKADRQFKLSTHSRIDVKEAEVNGCEMCHGPASIHVEASGGLGNIVNPKKDPSTCFKCHTDKQLEFRLPYHHPVPEGKMSCSDCHNAHEDDVKPWTATSMDGANEACIKCHKDKRGPYVWEHEAMREGCQSCHKVHGSIHDKLLIVRDNNLCLRCHMQRATGKLVGNDHATSAGRGSCWMGGCHSAVHGSNFNEDLRTY